MLTTRKLTVFLKNFFKLSPSQFHSFANVCFQKSTQNMSKCKEVEKEQMKTHRKKALEMEVFEQLVLKARSVKNPLAELPAFTRFERNGVVAEIEFKNVNELDVKTLEWILDLVKRNMSGLYEECNWGWNEKKKKKELTDSTAKYLIARVDKVPVAYTHFRFDLDYDEPVLYCYELQLEEQVRRKGLGKFLMQVLELMAFKNNLKKIVLTVLNHNKAAVDFFYSLKYTRDETNPTEEIFDFIPYEILSKINPKWK